MKKESLIQAKNAFLIEKECIETMVEYFDEEAYLAEVEGADDIKQDNDNGENKLPVAY